MNRVIFVLSLGLCAGIGVATSGRLVSVECVLPGCGTELDRATLWPFEDPNFYVRCEGNGAPWQLVRVPCTGRRLFHFARQSCMLPEHWEEPCAVVSEPTIPGLCPEVRCETAADLRQLWPDPDPSWFHQCIPLATGGIAPVPNICPYGTMFSVQYQACISVHRWQRECVFEGENTPDPTGGDTDPTTTESISSTTTTTQQIPTGPSWELCMMPDCEPQDPWLYPHSDRTYFWQCVPLPNGFWQAQARPCAAGTWFHYGLQQCVFPADWVNFCTTFTV